ALSKRMAVPTLLDLENERALSLQGSRAVQELRRHGSAAPGIHLWTPGRIPGQVRKSSESDGDQHHCQDCYGPPFPAFLSLTGEERKQEQSEDDQDGTDEQGWCFERGRE